MKEQESDMTSLNFNMRKSNVWCPPLCPSNVVLSSFWSSVTVDDVNVVSSLQDHLFQ